MKIYLILLAISIIANIIVTMEMNIYIHRNYQRIKKSPISVKIVGILKIIILTLLIFPYLINLSIILFNYDKFIEMMDNRTLDEEYWELK